MKEEINYRLDSFEGPLDLLLSLIEKNKLSITDIPIAEICDQYLDFIEKAREMDLEIASEFIVMASHLMLMKSKMLLPQDREEVMQLKAELQDTLALYKQAKLAVEELRPLYAEYSGRMVKEEDEIPPEKGNLTGFDPMILSKAFNVLITRWKQSEESPALIKPLIQNKVYSVEDRIEVTVSTLTERGESSLFYLLRNSESRGELIAYFMGILELIKIRRILIVSMPKITEDDSDDELGLKIMFILNPDYVPTSENTESEFDEHEKENGNEEPENTDAGN